jgi:hypothetical protein
MANEEISLDSMRSLFRLLDEDGGGSLSANEIKKGMLLLGFSEAEDPVALGRLVQNIDEDQTGTIDESEFLSFMSKESRKSLKKKLGDWSLKYTYMKATRYPLRGELNVDVAEVSKSCLEALVRDAQGPDSAYTTWLDVVGYDRSTFQALADLLDMKHDDLSDMLLFSVPTCGIVKGRQGPMVSIVVHHAELSLEPVPLKSRSLVPPLLRPLMELVVGSDSVTTAEVVRKRRLADKSAVADIVVSLEQAALLVAGERLLVTFRLPCVEFLAAQAAAFRATAEDSATKPAWAPAREAPRAGGRAASPFASDASSVRLRFEQVRRRLPTAKIHAVVKDSQAPAPSAPGGRRQRRSLEAQSNGDARLLAVLLVDALVSSNYGIRDRMQDWDELLEASIRGQQCSANTIHLQAMDAVVANFRDMLDPLARALDPEAWAEGGELDDDAIGSGPIPSMTEVQDFEPPQTRWDCPDEGSQSGVATLSGGSGGAAAAATTAAAALDSGPTPGAGPEGVGGLSDFFRHELPFFKELARDVSASPALR